MTPLEIILALTNTGLLVALPLVGLYSSERVKNLAREKTDRALAGLKLENDKLIESLRAGEARRSTEFSLYAQQRHRAYPLVYRRYRRALDGLSGMVRLPDFARFSAADARIYLDDAKVTGSVADDIVAAYERSDKGAPRQLRDLHERLRLSSAQDQFRRAVNAEVLEELYLSDDVRARIEDVRTKLAGLSSALEHLGDTSTADRAKASREAVEALYQLMRSELRQSL